MTAGSKKKMLWQFQSVSSSVKDILWVSPGYDKESRSVNVLCCTMLEFVFAWTSLSCVIIFSIHLF